MCAPSSSKAAIVYKRNGRYDQAGLAKINRILRDWRRNEPTAMDPQLLDLLWEAYRQSGATGHILVIGGYRAPATNALLRSRSRGVAENSQHMLGKAIDFVIPGVPLQKLRDISLKIQGGGVGYYPNSGSPFVHMDTGNIRHWPGITRQELARIFPSGRTLHVPSDGKPLPGYEEALAAEKSGGASGRGIDQSTTIAHPPRSGGLLSALLGRKAATEDATSDMGSGKHGQNIRTGSDRLRPDRRILDNEMRSVDVTPGAILADLPAHLVPVPVFATRSAADGGSRSSDRLSETITTHASFDRLTPRNVPLPTWRPRLNEPPGDGASVPLAAIEMAGTPLTQDLRLRGRRMADEQVMAPDDLSPATDVASRRFATNRKQGRPRADDALPKLMAVTAYDDMATAQWALFDRLPAMKPATGQRQDRALAHLRQPPRVMYPLTFRKDNKVIASGRFIGFATHFLPIVRFEG